MLEQGIFKGKGSGQYEGIKSFEYDYSKSRYFEQVEFEPVPGKPVVMYRQKTRHAVSLNPMHSESGYFKFLENNKVELILAHANGLSVIEKGQVSGNKIELNCGLFIRSDYAKKPFVKEYKRVINVLQDRIEYQVFMSTEEKPMQLHLTAVLEKQLS